MQYEAPELATIGDIQDIVRGPGEMDSEGCGCEKFLFEPNDLIEILDQE